MLLISSPQQIFGQMFSGRLEGDGDTIQHFEREVS